MYGEQVYICARFILLTNGKLSEAKATDRRDAIDDAFYGRHANLTMGSPIHGPARWVFVEVVAKSAARVKKPADLDAWISLEEPIVNFDTNAEPLVGHSLHVSLAVVPSVCE